MLILACNSGTTRVLRNNRIRLFILSKVLKVEEECSLLEIDLLPHFFHIHRFPTDDIHQLDF